MKHFFPILLVVLLLLVSACEPLATPPTSQTQVPAVEQKIPTQSLPTQIPTSVEEPPAIRAPGKVTIDYAKNFTLEYRDGYKLLTVVQPWANAEQSFSYALIPRGTKPPKSIENAMVVETPIRSLVTMSTTYFPFLELIGQLESIIAVDDATYAYNPTVRARVQDKSIQVVGGGAGGGIVNVEKLIELQPDVIMTSASGSPEIDSHPKLMEADLPVVINADYLESSPLGRAEWGKFIAAFFDLEDLAAQKFDEVVKNYHAVRGAALQVEKKVTVFTNTDYQGTWYVPGGESYAALIIKDAGGVYLFDDQIGSVAPLAFEQVYNTAKDADFWLNVGFPSDKTTLLSLDARYADFEAFKANKVYNYNLRASEAGGVDYFESGVAQPDIVLKDLVKIFYPELLPDHQLYYYQVLK